MNLSNLNPLKWITKKSKKDEAESSRVYIHLDPSHPHVGLSGFSDQKLPGPSLCVEGISLAAARVDLCGKVIDWSRMDPQEIEAIRIGGRVTLHVDTFKSLFK